MKMAGMEEVDVMTEVEDMRGIVVMKGIMTGMKKDVKKENATINAMPVT